MNTKKTPFVSIIVPYYNHNHFITKTLDSVLEDTYPNKEIIIINDGSSNPDDSNIVQWIDSFQQQIQIRYIKRENKGLTKTLNELVNISDGKYIVVCASDDYLINDTITRRVEILENNPNKLLLVSDNIVVNNDGELISNSNLFEYRKGKKKNYLSDNGLKHAVISNWGMAGACYIANKKIYEEIGPYDENLIVEDWDFMLRAVSKNLVLYYDEKVSAYRTHEDNTCNNPNVSLEMYENQTFVSQRYISHFDFPYNILLFKRHLKYRIKLKKMKKEFPYNLWIWQFYKNKKEVFNQNRKKRK